MKTRLVIFAIAAVFVLFVAGIILRNVLAHERQVQQTQTVRAPLVHAIELEQKTHTLTERVYGLIEGEARVTLSFQITGRIQLLGPGATEETPKTIDEGAIVRRGDVIAVVERERYLAELQAAEATVAQREAALEQSRASVEEAVAREQNLEDEYNRVVEAAEGGAVNPREVVRARQDLVGATASAKQARAAQSAAEADVELAQAQAAQARVRLGDATLVAPIDGVIADLPTEPDEIVVPGQTVAVLISDSKVKLRAPLVERKAVRLTLGQRAQIHVRALERQPAYLGLIEDVAGVFGEVTLVPPAADPMTGLFNAEITIDNRRGVAGGGRGLLKDGMIARAEIELATRPFYLVPTEAVRFVDGAAHVFMTEDAPSPGDGLVARLVPIEPEGEDDDFFLLTSPPRGLALIVQGQNLLRDGDAVRVAAVGPGATAAAQ